MSRIPFQVNDAALVALLPDGRVEFLDVAARESIEAHNEGRLIALNALDSHVLTEPEVDLWRFHLSAPAIAFIETTNLCNLRCTHCYADSGIKRPQEISTERIFSLLDEFGELGVLQVFLTGGEIFSHPNAVDIIRHARTKPFSTQIFTNGLLITDKKLAAIPPGQSFFISFDTADPERTVRGKMDFPKLRHIFEMMRKHQHVFRTAISVHRNNIEDAEEIFDWCAFHGYPRPQWLETHPIGRALLHPDMLLEPDQVDQVFDVYKRCMERYSAEPDEDQRSSPAEGRISAQELRGVDTIKFCQRLERATNREKCARTVAYVDSAGNVYPCSNCMSNNMYRGGNLRDRSFKSIWEQGFDAFREITFDDYGGCRTCPVDQADIWCQFRCPPLARNVSADQFGCGATDYLREFTLRTGQYWAERRRRNLQLTLAPTSRPHHLANQL